MKLSLAVSVLVAAASVGVQAQNIVDVAVGIPETFSTLVDLVVAAELDELLATTEDITVFAPTNDAFAALDPAIVENLLTEEWKLHLQNTLAYHVVPAVVPASAVTDGLVATTLNGENITLSVPEEGSVVINNSSNVVQADVEADNGLIHGVDQVLLPSWVTSNIVDIGMSDPSFSTLVDLVIQAELVDTLSTGGPYTLFAPINDAFTEILAALESEGVELPLDTDLVTVLLTYHVVEGIYPASSIQNGTELQTIQGETITFSLTEDGALVNDIPIVFTDVLANNGIVHVIDGVLVPQEAVDLLGSAPSPTADVPAEAPTGDAAPTGDMNEPGEEMTPTMAPSAAAGNTVVVSTMASVFAATFFGIYA